MTAKEPSGRYTPPAKRQPGHFDVAILVDPEMALPDDPSPARKLQVVAVWAPPPMDTFDTLGELIMRRTAYEAQMNAVVTEAQAGIREGDHVTYSPAGLAVYGRVFGPVEMARREREEHGVNTADAAKLERRVADAMRRGWLYGWWWSRIDRGEWGAVHRAWIERLVPVFEYTTTAARMNARVEPLSRFENPADRGDDG